MAAILMTTTVFSDFRVQYRAGDVKVKRPNGITALGTKDKLSPNAIILTGTDGRVALTDLSSGNVVMISRGKTVLLSSMVHSAVHDPGTLRVELAKRQVNTMAAVRANETGIPGSGHGWDEGTVNTDHSMNWADYKAGRFAKVQAATTGTTDPEGLFLQAQSTYMVSGSKDGPRIEKILEKILRSNLSIPLKSESQKTLAILVFERGDFEKAYSYATTATKTLAAAEIDAPLYYVLILSARMVGEDTKAEAALAQMIKFHPDSPLIKKIPSEQ